MTNPPLTCTTKLKELHLLPLWPTTKLTCGPKLQSSRPWHIKFFTDIFSMIPYSASLWKDKKIKGIKRRWFLYKKKKGTSTKNKEDSSPHFTTNTNLNPKPCGSQTGDLSPRPQHLYIPLPMEQWSVAFERSGWLVPLPRFHHYPHFYWTWCGPSWLGLPTLTAGAWFVLGHDCSEIASD